jgi:DNA-binding NarL/FixJ family response regulator
MRLEETGNSNDVVQEALSIGTGFVLKSEARRELLPAIKSVIIGRQFVSSRLRGRILGEVVDMVISP